jgi:hypothetical protein
MEEMKNHFKKALRIYLYILPILSVGFWFYMIYDDMIFIKQYGIDLDDMWNWFLWYFSYCFLGFTLYYWVFTTLGILIYNKIKKMRTR